MESTSVILKPLITEKATFGSSEQNRYSFQVDRRANKHQIKKAVEELYGVRVLEVATQTRMNKLRRTRFGWMQHPPIKRAIVKVHPEDKIELF